MGMSLMTLFKCLRPSMLRVHYCIVLAGQVQSAETLSCSSVQHLSEIPDQVFPILVNAAILSR